VGGGSENKNSSETMNGIGLFFAEVINGRVSRGVGFKGKGLLEGKHSRGKNELELKIVKVYQKNGWTIVPSL